jgi:hypothetical protein
MNTLTHSDTFFIISSFGFVTLWILVAIFLVYLIRIMHLFSRIMEKIEKDVDKISETTKDMFLDMRESAVFKFLFGKKKSGRKKMINIKKL